MDLISVEQQDGQQFTFQVRQHVVTVDQEGCGDLGPTPSEVLVGAFGTCMGMALARYCNTIRCPGRIDLYLTYQLADSPKRIEAIVVDVELPEDFPKNRRKAVMNVIAACPVHNTLTTPPRIDIEITD